jgi:hypothetical protein
MKTSTSDVSRAPLMLCNADLTAMSSSAMASNLSVPITLSSQSKSTKTWSWVSVIAKSSAAERE